MSEICMRCGRKVPARLRGSGYCTVRCLRQQQWEDAQSAVSERGLQAALAPDAAPQPIAPVPELPDEWDDLIGAYGNAQRARLRALATPERIAALEKVADQYDREARIARSLDCTPGLVESRERIATALGGLLADLQRLARAHAVGGVMRALSIRQPWAWLIVHGYKDVENRDWASSYTGPLLIHAGKSFDWEGAAWVRRRFPGIPLPADYECERGGIVGQCRMTGCVTSSPSPWFVGRYGFTLADARPLPFRALRGQLGLFEVEEG